MIKSDEMFVNRETTSKEESSNSFVMSIVSTVSFNSVLLFTVDFGRGKYLLKSSDKLLSKA